MTVNDFSQAWGRKDAEPIPTIIYDFDMYDDVYDLMDKNYEPWLIRDNFDPICTVCFGGSMFKPSYYLHERIAQAKLEYFIVYKNMMFLFVEEVIA